MNFSVEHIKLMQAELNDKGAHLVVDGIWGVKSDKAFHDYINVKVNKQGPPEDRTKNLNLYYGKPDWVGNTAPNQVYINTPYKMVLAWDEEAVVSRIKCNIKAAKSLEAALQEFANTLSYDQIQERGLHLFAGVLNVRLSRGSNFPSRHSWGAAIDLDSKRNSMNTTLEDSHFAKYPDVFNVFHKHGWVSGGLMWGHDVMHWQRTKAPLDYPKYRIDGLNF